MVAKKGSKKKVAALPAQLKKAAEQKKKQNSLFEKRPRNFRIGKTKFNVFDVNLIF